MTIKLRRYRRQSEVAPVMSTSNSASFDAEDRANRDSQPLRRTKIRYSSRTETNVIMPKALATAFWHPTGWGELVDHPRAGRRPVGSDLDWSRARLQRAGEER